MFIIFIIKQISIFRYFIERMNNNELTTTTTSTQLNDTKNSNTNTNIKLSPILVKKPQSVASYESLKDEVNIIFKLLSIPFF